VNPDSRPNLAWLLALGLLVLTVSLRLPGMIGWWINPDEGAYFSMVTWAEWGSFWKEVEVHAHPPLYYVLLRLVGLFTHEFLWLRAVALVSGTFAVPLAFLVGRELNGNSKKGLWMGLLAGLVLAVSPAAILISQIMRPYALQLFLLLAAFLALLRWRRDDRARFLVVYALALSLALLTHYSSMFIFATFGALVGFDLLSGRMQRKQIARLVLANLVPIFIVTGLYLFHLRPHLLQSRMATEALDGWLEPFMIDSIADVWLNLLGFFGYLAGPWLAGPALILFLLGVGLAVGRRSWALAVSSLAALGVAIFAASVGKYPLGACRQSSWLIGFLLFPLALVPALGLTSGRKVATATGVAVVLVGLAGPVVGGLVGGRESILEPVSEQLLWRADLESMDRVFAKLSEPGILLLSYQTYYLLVPKFERERESRVLYPEGGFFRFQWGAREVLVSEEWAFSVHPERLDEPDHLYNFIQAVDRELPEMRLSEQREVLMFFGGWLEVASSALERANELLPPSSPLAVVVDEAPGFRAFEVDVAKFQQWFAGYLESLEGQQIN
jgi:hypothetical protein